MLNFEADSEVAVIMMRAIFEVDFVPLHCPRAPGSYQNDSWVETFLLHHWLGLLVSTGVSALHGPKWNLGGL